MKKISLFLLIFAVGILPVLAGNPWDIFSASLDEEVILYVGQSRSFDVSEPERISIDDYSVADVTRVSDSKMWVVAKQKGETSLTWRDKRGDHYISIKVYPARIGILKDTVENIISRFNIRGIEVKPLEAEGKVMVSGTVKRSEQKERLMAGLEGLRERIVDAIVVEKEEIAIEIEAKVFEIQTGAVKELGFQWPERATYRSPAGTTLAGLPDTFFRITDWTSADSLAATVSFLATQGKAQVLSRPKLVCRSGREANLTVGGEVPILTTTQSEVGTVGNVEYKDYGITLNIRPEYKENNRIDIGLAVEVSDIEEAVTLGEAALAYPITKRAVTTDLTLDDGQTIMIGGLIRQKTSEELKEFPWLTDIPILGAFFRRRRTTAGGDEGDLADSELFITLTPRVVYRPEDEVIDLSHRLPKTQKTPEYFALRHQQTPIPAAYQDYVLSVQRQILENITYPHSLSGLGREGHLILGLILDSRGEIKDIRILKSSGNVVFDRQAIKEAKALTYQSFPPQVEKDHLEIKVPIFYKQ